MRIILNEDLFPVEEEPVKEIENKWRIIFILHKFFIILQKYHRSTNLKL